MTKVKICGLSTRAAAEVATESGASWLGAILSPGFRRSVLPQEARAMWDGLEPSHVGVWVNATEQEMLAGSDRAGAGVAQLAGVESPAAAKALRHALTVWKVVRPANWYELEMEARQWNGAVDALVVEGSSETGASGGAGLIAPWARLGDLSSFPLPIILAGGLTPLNVAEAISIVHPMAVDVSSGVETDGIKDETKIREFIERARAG